MLLFDLYDRSIIVLYNTKIHNTTINLKMKALPYIPIVETRGFTANMVKVYTTEVVVEEQEFAESKNASRASNNNQAAPDKDGFMDIPDDIGDELPFH